MGLSVAERGRRIATFRYVEARLMEIAAAVVQANAAVRDLSGVCLFDEDGVRSFIRPGRGGRHLLAITHALSDSAGLMPEARGVPLERLLPLAYGVVQDLHPERLERDVNAMPAWLPYWVAARSMVTGWTPSASIARPSLTMKPMTRLV